MDTIVDTDALVGLFNTRDAHNKEASRIFEELNKRGVTTLILPTTLSEFAALFADDVGMKEAHEATDKIIDFGISIIEISEDLTMQAIAMYFKQGSRKESLFDCFI